MNREIKQRELIAIDLDGYCPRRCCSYRVLVKTNVQINADLASPIKRSDFSDSLKKIIKIAAVAFALPVRSLAGQLPGEFECTFQNKLYREGSEKETPHPAQYHETIGTE